MSLKDKTQSLFAEKFGYPATHVIQAPGRVNLIGEHTDYNDGFVLPCAIDYQTVISCAKRDDRHVRVIAADYGNEIDEFFPRCADRDPRQPAVVELCSRRGEALAKA